MKAGLVSVSWILSLVVPSALPAQAAQTARVSPVAARAGIAEIRARPCPAGMQQTSDELIAMSQVPPDQYWQSVAAMDQMRHSPEYTAQFNAALQQTRAQVAAAGGDVSEVDRMGALFRDDPAVMMRCQPAGARRINQMPMAGMPGMGPPGAAGMATMPGVPGAGGGDMIKAGLTQGMSSALPMLGPAGMVAGAVAPAAVPIASKAVGGLLGKNKKTPEGIAKDLVKGEAMSLDGVKFSIGDAAFGTTDFAERLGTLAEAVKSVEGVFFLYIQPEAERGVEPDPELAKKRLEKVMAQLEKAGLEAGRVVGTTEQPPYGKFDKVAKPGEARIYLIRKRGA